MGNSDFESPTNDPGEMVDEHGDALFRFAMYRVHDTSVAEDLVQETFLAAIKCRSFAGRSSERTWLTAILKNKISDHFRVLSRRSQAIDDEMFDEQGFWLEEAAPAEWMPTPEGALSALELRHVIAEALDDLPDRLRQIFLMREVSGLERQEICRLMDITDSNYWTSMHRARLALRSQVERRWLVPHSKAGENVGIRRLVVSAHVL